MTKWKSHGNGLISRKYGSEIGAVTFAIDVLGTVHERIHGDCVDPTVETHIWLHVLDWSNEPLLDETPLRADATHRIPYRLCILPSYDAASADGCLGIVMAAEGCSLREMFDLVPTLTPHCMRSIGPEQGALGLGGEKNGGTVLRSTT